MKRRYLFLVGLSLALIGADQGTKWWAATSLAEARMERTTPACDDEGPVARRTRYRALRTVHVIEGLFSFRYVENCAGAFGILSGQPESVRRPFFLAVSIAAVIFIVLLFRRLTPDQRLLTWALPFVLGGALGNLIDRIHLRYVIDFIDWYHESIGRWPTFNIADAAIVVGVGLILLDMWPIRRAAAEKESSDKEKSDKNRTKRTNQDNPLSADDDPEATDDEPAADLDGDDGQPSAEEEDAGSDASDEADSDEKKSKK